MNKNCYECIHRGTIPGDCHSSCQHPLVVGESVGNAKRNLGIVGNQHGIDNDWFVWPYNFDPIWLESCDGFKERV